MRTANTKAVWTKLQLGQRDQMMQFIKQSLAENGFQGFISICQLKSENCTSVPRQMGVYVIFRESLTPPAFRAVSIGGHFKSKDPTVPEHLLREQWVVDAMVIYIGKAGGRSQTATLQSRMRQYMQFGCGKPVGHRGGRFIWQLADCEDLLVAWKPLDLQEPRQVEREMISDFIRIYGVKPFANLNR
ncbi:MAG: hypothetical protein ABFD54_18130 [Armatimonadota bacterium]|nr:hypothetical protein [bacterium]